jgi:hypothetical protein
MFYFMRFMRGGLFSESPWLGACMRANDSELLTAEFDLRLEKALLCVKNLETF